MYGGPSSNKRNIKEVKNMEALTKFAISQVFGIGATIVVHLLCQEVAGTTPIVIPATTWIATSIYTIAKI
jgi:hypothetical protein